MGKSGAFVWLHDRGVGNRIVIAPDVVSTAEVIVLGNDNEITIEAGTEVGSDGLSDQGIAIRINGDRNRVSFGSNSKLALNVHVEGDDCVLHVGNNCNLTFNSNLRDAGQIIIGDQTTIVKGALQVHEKASISIGRDCMISTLVYLSVSDIHPIYDRANGTRINPPASITIGDHVWLGLRSMILKGATISDGAIIAAGAIVSGHVPANAIMAGSPARVQRENVEWHRDFD